MTERKVIRARKQAIRRARLKKAGTVAAMLPLVVSKGAPVATLVRGRHNEDALGIEQMVEISEQEMADIVLPEAPAEEIIEEEEEFKEEETQEEPRTLPAFEAPQTFVAPSFSEGGLTNFEGNDAYLGIAPLAVNWVGKENWPWAEITHTRWVGEDQVEITFRRELSTGETLGTGQIGKMEFVVEIGEGDKFLDNVSFYSGENAGGGLYRIILEGITEEAFGDITVYVGDPDNENSFRLDGAFLRPSPFVPIVLTERHIHQGRVADKFVGDEPEADVEHWPHLDLSDFGFRGNLDFTSKIADIVFARVTQVGASRINYGNVSWNMIEQEIADALNAQDNLPVGQYYRVEIPAALRDSLTGTGLFHNGNVLENIPVAIHNIQVNRGRVHARPFDGTRMVQSIAQHISLSFEIQMAKPGDTPVIPSLEVQLPVDILRYDRASLWASFVHLAGNNRFEEVHQAVLAAAAGLSYDLSDELLRELTQSILTQSAVQNPTGNSNGLYDGQITLAEEGFTPMILGNLQNVPDKVFDNTNTVSGVQEGYRIEFGIMGANPAGEGTLRFATASLAINPNDLVFDRANVGTHKINLRTASSMNLQIRSGERDILNPEDLSDFIEAYGGQIEKSIRTMAENGGLFNEATITPKPVTWIAGRVDDKVYDGTARVSGIVPPRLKGFVAGDTNIIDVEFGTLAERLHFANSLPGSWEIEGLDFDERMLNRKDYAGGGNFNYKIMDQPQFELATIRPLVLEVNDFNRLTFVRNKVSRQYDRTVIYKGSLDPIFVTINGVDEGEEHIYQLLFSEDGVLRFEDNSVTANHVEVYLEESTILLQRQGGETQPVELSEDLQDYLRNKLFLCQITPRQIFWGMGQVKDKDYDGNKSATLTDTGMSQLFSARDRDDFAIHDLDKEGDQAVILNHGSAEFQSRNVARDDQGDVIAQPVVATEGWTISGYLARNYEIVPDPDRTGETAAFDLPDNLFGQSAFGMPNFFYTALIKPSFADATIRPLDVHFTNGSLISSSRTYTGRPIRPELSDFLLPTLSTVLDDKQDLLEREMNDRITVVEGGFVHTNNREVGTAVSALSGWDIGGTHHTNYRLINSPDIEWEITVKQITSWQDVVGAQAGFATKIFDDTNKVLEDQFNRPLNRLPSFGRVRNPDALNIEGWELTFDSADAGRERSLTIGNTDKVRAQLETLFRGNQVLAEDFDFNSLFAAEITPRILRWENGSIPSRPYNSSTDIIGTISLPELVRSEVGHEILANHVEVTHNSNLLSELVFPDTAIGSYTFNWFKAVGLSVEFADPRHEGNYVVPELGNASASILPVNIVKEDIMGTGFTVESREYDGQTEISDNDFVAIIALEGGHEITLPYRVEGLRFANHNAGTRELEFALNGIVFDEKINFFEERTVANIVEEIEQYIRAFRKAEITPRRIAWTEGRVSDKEWDDTDKVHNIFNTPRLIRLLDTEEDVSRVEEPEVTVLESAIVARDWDIITVAQGGAQFTQTEVGEDIPVVSDDNWQLVVEPDKEDEHPLTNYTFGSDNKAGEMLQPHFASANIWPVSITDVQPMPENPSDMKNNILYIQSGYIERQYNGTAQIDLIEDMNDEPKFALRNEQGQDIKLTLEHLENLSVRFQDENVAYNNGNVADKGVITSVGGLNLANVELSDAGLREIEELLFTGRITPWELNKSHLDEAAISLVGDSLIRKEYNGETAWTVPEIPDLDNAGENIKLFPELGIEIVGTEVVIPILFGEDYEIVFEDRHAGNDKQVTIEGFYLDSRNVSLHSDFKDWMSEHLLAGEITPMVIQWTQGRVERRRYDGTTEARIAADTMPSLPILAVDKSGVNIQTGQAQFDDANVRFDDEGNVAAMPVHALGTGEWSISGEYSGNYWLQPSISSALNSILPARQALLSFSPRPIQSVNPLFESQAIDPVRLSFNGRKIAERVFNYDYYFTAEDKTYEYGVEAGFDKPEKWTNVDTGEPMDAIGGHYLTITFVDQMSRLANGQPHVAEDELIFVDAQGNVIERADVLVELRDEDGNVNRNYEYVFADNVETIGRITKAQGFPVTRPQAARVEKTEIELFHSQIMMHDFFLEGMPLVFEPLAFNAAGTELTGVGDLFAAAADFDPGPYQVEYAVSRTENPEDLDAAAWQQSTLFTDLLPGTEYFLFARQAEHHNRYEGEIIAGATVVTLGEAPPQSDNGGPGGENGRPDNDGTGEQNNRPDTEAGDAGEVNEQDKGYPSEEDKSFEGETKQEDEGEIETIQKIRAELPSTGDMVGLGLGIAGLAALVSAVVLRKKNKK
ncbi:LPXTG cell wall anchor domain-containing protein [Lactococcus ileimucosae]|uniref:LPXTG cell wall anchor domain-containing protein n=1 Tax=Lactococcus ileimucosae TaxID=2941329 RepID=A0ABV4D7A6_9LACT